MPEQAPSARHSTGERVRTCVCAPQARLPEPPMGGVFDVTIPALMEQPLTLEEGSPTIQVALGEMVGKIRESIVIKRAARVMAQPGPCPSAPTPTPAPTKHSPGMGIHVVTSTAAGEIGAYVHGSNNAAFPRVGTTAAVVPIQSVEELSIQHKETLRVRYCCCRSCCCFLFCCCNACPPSRSERDSLVVTVCTSPHAALRPQDCDALRGGTTPVRRRRQRARRRH